MSSEPGPRLLSFEVAPGVVLRLAAPALAADEAESALPAVDVSAVPGAAVVLRRGFREGGEVVRAACVTAPSDRWAPGVEELVLGRATGLATAALGAAGASVERWEPGAIVAAGGRFEQRLVGRAGEREVAGIGHTLAFVGAEHDVLLCSVGCAGGAACGELLAAVRVEGALVAVPPPSPLVRAVLFAAEQPYETAAGVAVAGAIAVAVLLARRPRVPWRA